MAIETASEPKGHLVLFAYEAWGHTRPLCNFASRLVKLRMIHITFFTTEGFAERARAEILRNFEPGESHLAGLIRVVGLSNKSANPLDHSVLDAAFAAAYEKLVKSEVVTCAATGVQYDPLPSPDAALIDFFASSELESIKKLSQKPVKVFAWYSAAASALLSFYGPESAGGNGDLYSKVVAQVRMTGKPVDEVVSQIVLACDGSIMNIPGLPPMYDYEFYPQRVPFAKAFGLMMLATQIVLSGCDGVVLSTAECYEPKTLEAVRDFYNEKSKKIYVCGPLLSSGSRAMAYERNQSQKSAEIEHFMDRVLASNGEQSIIYISFGSLFWSSQPEKIWAVVDVIVELKLPFILSHASPWAIIPEDKVQKVKDYGNGMMMAWAPQQLILSHPALGWFVTHCGQNGVIESITYGVPMICWPSQFDQPTNAAHLTCNLNIAYELFEVRTANGLKPVHRIGRAPEGSVDAVRKEAREVFEKAFSEDGQKKRENIQQIRQALAGAWDDEGEARLAALKFLDEL